MHLTYHKYSQKHLDLYMSYFLPAEGKMVLTILDTIRFNPNITVGTKSLHRCLLIHLYSINNFQQTITINIKLCLNFIFYKQKNN